MIAETAFPLLLASLCLLVAHVLRASRIALLFPAGALRGRFNLLVALSLGYAANVVLPLRIGELVRAWFVSRREAVGFVQSAAIIGAERLSDLIVVAIVVAVFDRHVLLPAIFGATAVLIVIAAILTARSTRARALIWATTAPFNDRIRIGTADFAWRLGELVTSGALVKPRYLARTALMWTLYLLSYILFARATGYGLGDAVAILLGMPLRPSGEAIIHGSGHDAVAMLLFIALPLAAVFVYGALRHRRFLARFLTARSRRGGAPARLRRAARDRFKAAGEYEVFLLAMFGARTHAIAGFGLQALDDGLVHRLYHGGSEAITALVEVEGRLLIRKFAIGDAGDKLAAQTAWLGANRSPDLPLVEMLGERRGKGSYLYDMPLVVPAADFYDVIHTSPTARSVAILDAVAARVDGFHRRNARGMASEAEVAAYLDAKIVRNARAILEFARAALPGAHYGVNGHGLDLAMWDRLLNPVWLAAQIRHRETAAIHGDLTVENIIVAPDRAPGWYLIDPNPGNIFDTPLLDWAKLMQSLHLGYETLSRGAACGIEGDAIRLPLAKSEAYSVLHRRLIELIRQYRGEDALREVHFHEIAHYLRLTPYKIRRDPQQGLCFFACTSLLLDQYIRGTA